MPRGKALHRPEPKDWLTRIGLFGIYLFSGFALLGITPATVGLVLLAVAFVVGFRDWRTLGRDPLVVTTLVFATYVACHSLVTYLKTPIDALAAAAADAGFDWVKLLLFIPFAFWAGGRPERVRMLLLLSLAGFVLGALRSVEWGQFDLAFFTTRFESYLPAIAFGMFAGLGTLGLIALRNHFWHPESGSSPRWLRSALWLLLLFVTLEGLVLSFSRGCWLSFAAAVPLLIYLEWRAHRHAKTQSPKLRAARIAVASVVVVALAVAVTFQHRQIAQRLQGGGETLSRALSGNLAGMPSSSSGLRVHALRFALDLWLQRPWVGWGAGSSRYLLAHSGRQELMMTKKSWLPHLHNTYAEILVQLGAIGFALIAALLWLLARGAALSCRRGQMPGDICRFFTVSLLFVLVWNLSNYRFVRHDYMFFWIIFAGSAYSFRLRFLLEQGQRRLTAHSPGKGG